MDLEEGIKNIEFRPYRFLKRKLDLENLTFTQNVDNKGTPFLLVNDEVYVCWVSSRHSQAFKVEWPYPGGGENKLRCKNEASVIKELKGICK